MCEPPRLSRIGAPALTLVMDELIKVVGGLNVFAIGLVGSSCHLKISVAIKLGLRAKPHSGNP